MVIFLQTKYPQQIPDIRPEGPKDVGDAGKRQVQIRQLPDDLEDVEVDRKVHGACSPFDFLPHSRPLGGDGPQARGGIYKHNLPRRRFATLQGAPGDQRPLPTMNFMSR